MITIDKKYLGPFANCDSVIGDYVEVLVKGAMIVFIDGDRYTLELPDLERDAFMDRASKAMFHTHPDATEDMLETLYDAGARFK